VIAHKFLASGAKGPFSGYAWPTPQGGAAGAWIEVEGPLALCRSGVHLCRPCDLAHWLHDELWAVESDGEQMEGLDCIIVRRARLVRRIDIWREGGAARFARACIDHAKSILSDRGSAEIRDLLEDARLAAEAGYFATSAFASALAAAKVSPTELCEQAYRRERVWQSEWITRELVAT
jgi:hypothetical protein